MELPYIDENSQFATYLFSSHEPPADRTGATNAANGCNKKPQMGAN
jgi:hypothetical protein